MKALIFVTMGFMAYLDPSVMSTLVAHGVESADSIDDAGQLISFNCKKQNTSQDPYILG